MHHLYRAYGLTIASDVDLPELQAKSDGGGDADVRISVGRVPAEGLSGGKQISPFAWVDDDVFWLRIPDIARFMVRGGAHITVEPAPDVDAASVRVFLLGSVLGAVLFQRGLFLLHGNAIEVDGRCLICVGPSGVGKSTLATRFVQRGFRILADDVVPIDPDCRAIPGFPRLKIWQESAERLDIATEGKTRVRPGLEKFSLPITDSFCDRPLPVRWIYLLGVGLLDRFEVSPISGMQRFAPLRANTYRLRFVEGMSLTGVHLKRCGDLAGRVHLATMNRPRAGFDVDGLVDAILADIEQVG